MVWIFIALLIQLAAAASPIPINRRPVVLWHGLGDSYNSEGMMYMKKIIEDEFPGIFVYSVYLDKSSSVDSRMSFFGSIDSDIDQVCEQLTKVPQLKDGFDAVGFSQGGLFLRGYIQRCNKPEVKTLVTFGSPHNGISDLPTCGSTDFWCQQRNRIMKTQLWTSYAQNNIISAQYYRDPEDLDTYLENSNFLADINNERDEKNLTYKENMQSIDKLVLVKFEKDETLVPKETSWFQEVNRTSGSVTPLEYREMYYKDWIGMKRLVDNKLIDYITVNGQHMEISGETMRSIAKKYLGNVKLVSSAFFKFVHQ